MGEARRKAARDATSSPAAIFAQLGIDTSAPGFYDNPAFQAREAADPSFLDQYGRFVRDRDFTADYLARARRLIPRIAAELHGEMAAAERQRACMDAGLTLSKMLEQTGLWNAVVRGAFTAEVIGRPQTRRYFHAFGSLEAGSSVHGHAWLLAPPFKVVDIAAKLQPWRIPAFADQIPRVVLTESADGVTPTLEMLVDHRAFARGKFLGAPPSLDTGIDPRVQRFMAEFRGSEIRVANIKLTYQPTAIAAPDVPFDRLATGPGGLTACRLWRERIRPRVADEL